MAKSRYKKIKKQWNPDLLQEVQSLAIVGLRNIRYRLTTDILQIINNAVSSYYGVWQYITRIPGFVNVYAWSDINNRYSDEEYYAPGEEYHGGYVFPQYWNALLGSIVYLRSYQSDEGGTEVVNRESARQRRYRSDEPIIGLSRRLLGPGY